VKRAQCSQDFLVSFKEDGEEFLDSIVTRDEIWAHYYTPETKEQSKQWRHMHSRTMKRCMKRSFRSCGIMVQGGDTKVCRTNEEGHRSEWRLRRKIAQISSFTAMY